MGTPVPTPQRYIGLDIHKHYLIAIGVDPHGAPVLGPRRVEWHELEAWAEQHLTAQDAVILEMTANAYSIYDDLRPHVHSVTVVHPPHVALIVRAQVKTDRKAALTLAQLHAAGLLPGVWVPPQSVRDQRALVAQRAKMVRLQTQVKNRLHAVLHRGRLQLPPGDPFELAKREWWLQLPLTAVERTRVECDLETLDFVRHQIGHLDGGLTVQATEDDRIPYLLQLPGINLTSAMTVLGAIGDVRRFPTARQLVGYAGLGARVHDSGQMHVSGGITKAGRRDLRTALIESAHVAANTHPHWKAELARLMPRLGYNKAIVAIARKLLVAVWHILTKQIADRFARPEQVAKKFMNHAYRLGRENRPAGQPVASYVREQLDRLQLGKDLVVIHTSTKRTMKLPPSRLNDGGCIPRPAA